MSILVVLLAMSIASISMGAVFSLLRGSPLPDPADTSFTTLQHVAAGKTRGAILLARPMVIGGAIGAAVSVLSLIVMNL